MQLRPRIIPCLTISNKDLVKTTEFKNPRYIGDPINAVKIFNGKGVDELCILDITATKKGTSPDFRLLEEIASEAFVPLSYGGGISSVDDAKRIFRMGYEKVIFNTTFFLRENIIRETIKFAGSQSVVVSIDVKRSKSGVFNCYHTSGSVFSNESVEQAIARAYNLGVGEIIINSIDNDGKMSGYDIELVKTIANSVDIPIVILGGAGKLKDIKTVLDMGIHAAAASSYFIFYGPLKAILITYPSENELYNIGILT